MKHTLLFLLIGLPFAVSAFSFVPPEIPGWTQDGDIEIFTGEDLYNHINGASEFYLSYNFQKLWVVRYKKGEAEIALEVYDHGDPVHAFGIYSMERPSSANVSAIGAEGYFEESILNFVAGRYYVKMNSFREPNAGSGVLLSTAGKLSPQLEENPELPYVVKIMPTENLVPNSCQYVSNTFMGLGFLGSAFRASYKTADGTLMLFVLEQKAPDEAKVILQKYDEFIQKNPGELKEGDYLFEDPFNGTIRMYWKGNYIIGFSGDDLPEVRESLLNSVKSKLFK
jgi:hypothetical protein